MNKVLKMLIKETIHNNIVHHKQIPTGDTYTIYGKNGTEVLSVINSWATNHYSVSINKKTVLSVKWDETNSRPLSPEQKDMIDIINACKEKTDLQETAQTMNAKEFEMANFLQKSLCNSKI